MAENNDFQQKIKEQQELEQQVRALEQLVKAFMASEAISRYSNLKMAHPEKALQVLTIMAQLIQKGKIKEKISDRELKNILLQLTDPKKQTKISY
ncbi:hypothetical protein HYT58_02310 [Candidatus Woesearchaeota archaeon]|nr:hypothetical protein [Candidatus Woesearchaeota archaeon]